MLPFKLKRAFSLLGLAYALLAAPGTFAGGPRTLTIRIPDEPETLDWNRALSSVVTYPIMNLMEGLVSFDFKMNVVPALAESWTVSADGKTYTFRLRADAKWSDGVRLTANDFVYGWRRLLSPVTASPSAGTLFDVEGAEAFHNGTVTDPAKVRVKALDDRTLEVRLVRPSAHWIFMPTFWATFPLRQDVVEKYGEAWATPGRMVTIGPYRLVLHDIGKQLVLEANPLYYGRHGNVQKLVFTIEKRESDALKLYDSGKIDFLTDFSASAIRSVRKRPDLRVFPYLKVDYLGFWTGDYLLANVSVRRAISMAIDRAALARLIFGAQPAGSFVPPPLPGSSRDIGLKYDPVAARAEFAKSGLDPYRRYHVSLALPDWEEEKTVGAFIRDQLSKNLPLDVDVVPLDNRTYRLRVDLHGSPLFLGHWGADYPDAGNFLSFFVNESGKNRFSWSNSAYEDLVSRARWPLAAAERVKDDLQAQKILLEQDAVVVPLYYQPKAALVRARVHGLTINPMNYLFLGDVNVDP